VEQKRTNRRKLTPKLVQFTKEYLKERAEARLEELGDDVDMREARILRAPLRDDELLDWRDDDNDAFDASRADYVLPAQAHMRGRINDRECTHCYDGRGVFMDCVSLDGEWNGACTNCAHGGHQSRCTHYSKRTTSCA